MDLDAPPIPFSTEDMERQRLESTLDYDLSSISLTVSNPPPSASFASSSFSSIGMARSAAVAAPRAEYPRFPDSTPRAMRRGASFARTDTTGGPSPTSTANHHVSAATLGAGVFRRPGGPLREVTEEFDPDRSLGRLVGELAKAMGEERMPQKPASPFVAPRSPRSPSPAPASLPNLSFSLSRNAPLPSPPQSRTVSAASRSSGNSRASGGSGGRPVLGETTRHNLNPVTVIVPSPKKYARRPAHVKPNETSDITGMTGLLATPAKGDEFGTLGKNSGPTGAGAAIPAALHTLHARLRALETENGVSRRRVRELEAEAERAREEVMEAQRTRDARLREVISEKTVLEDLVKSLREHLARLTAELEESKAMIAELRRAAHSNAEQDIAVLKRDVDRLTRDVARLNDIAHAGLLERSRAREARSVRIDALDLADEELDRVQRDVDRRVAQFANHATQTVSRETDALPSQLRQGLHATAAAEPILMPPSAKAVRVHVSSESEGEMSPTPASRTRSVRSTSRQSEREAEHVARVEDECVHSDRTPVSITSSGRRRRQRRVPDGPDSPFPSIRAQDEKEFFSPRPTRTASRVPTEAAQTERPLSRAERPASRSERPPSRGMERPTSRAERPATLPAHGTVRSILAGAEVPQTTVLARVIHELEADFAHYKGIYVELADQYKVLDAASAVAKRHVLAEHLKEVIDCLEQKADQIAALYSLMSVNDRPTSPSGEPRVHKSAPDLRRAIRDAVGKEAAQRLEADGLLR